MNPADPPLELPPDPEQIARVRDFLKGNTQPAPAPMSADDEWPKVELPPINHDLGTLPPEAEAFMQATARPKETPNAPSPPPAAEAPVRITVEATPTVQPGAPDMSQTAYWSMDTASLGKVQVEDDEKAIYLKAALTDTQIIWDIKLLKGQLTARVRSLRQYEYDVVFQALRLAIEDKQVQSSAEQYSYLQYYTCCLQVLQANGTGLQHLEFTWTEESDVRADAEKLRRHHATQMANMSSARWQHMLMAVRVFAVKEKICTEALANEDFWPPVGGD